MLLGAAIESTEDFLEILRKAGVVDEETIRAWIKEQEIKGGALFADALLALFPGLNLDCEGLNRVVWKEHLKATGKKEGPEGVINDPDSTRIGRGIATIDFALALKQMKKDGCSRPTHPYFSPPEQWDAL